MIDLEATVLARSWDNVQQGRPSQMQARFSLWTNCTQGDGNGRVDTLCVLTAPPSLF